MKCFSVKTKFLSKLLFLLMLSALSLQTSLAQCKLEKIIDQFDSSSTIFISKDINIATITPLIGLKEPWNLSMQFTLVDNISTIKVAHESTHSSSLNSIFFKFVDGTVIKKENPSNIYTYNNTLGAGSSTYTYFILSEAELMIFSSKDLLEIRAVFHSFNDYPVLEKDIKSKSADKFRKDATCILAELNSTNTTLKKANKECKYLEDAIDDFTKNRIVKTNREVIYISQSGKNMKFMNVSGNNLKGVNRLELYWGNTSISPSQYNQLDLLLENDEILSLKDDIPSDLVKIGPYLSHKVFLIDNDTTWMKLKTIPLKKIRIYLNGNDLGTIEMEKKFSESFMKVINCIDALGIPKSN